jgi:sensor histidine kinase YesM
MIQYYVEISLEGRNLSSLSEQELYKLRYALWYFFNIIVVFYTLVMFNLSWKNKLFKVFNNKSLNVPLLFMSNALLYIVLTILSLLAYNLFMGNYGVNITLISLYKNGYIGLTAFAFSYILILNQRSKTAEIENVRLKEEKVKAELASLKEQISPHFFFNTLSSLSAMIRLNDKKESLEFVDKMSQVYRYILESGKRDLVKLKEEVEFLKSYFFLIEKRFGKQLILNITIDPALHETLIPSMALQVLVENAIQHNSKTNSSPLTISVYNENDTINVQNNLQKNNGGESMGIGLPNLMKRYQLIADKEIIIDERDELFTVKLPIIA